MTELSNLWNLFLFQPLMSALVALVIIFGNLGVAIVLLTIILRFLLVPLTIPYMRTQKKMIELAPEIAKLKKKHAGDKQGFAKAQMELYRQAGANPAAGCLPMILQLLFLIALINAFTQVLQVNGTDSITKINEVVYPFLRLPAETRLDFSFLYLNLAKPDIIHFRGVPLPGVFLILAALAQLVSSKMAAPAVKKTQDEAKITPEKTDDMTAMMQGQMLYLFPIMTIFIGYGFASGVILYWFVLSAFQAVQQYFFTGWGGLIPWVEKTKDLVKIGKLK